MEEKSSTGVAEVSVGGGDAEMNVGGGEVDMTDMDAGDGVHQPMKHHADDNGTDDMPSESPPKKKKKRSSVGDVSKNALQVLNEMMPGLKYNCTSETGPKHQPTFTVQVLVNDEVR